jgi:glycosyltransferase involved in cell wall biosynthesis
MRIVHVITSVQFAGAERLLVNFTALHAARHDIEVVYFKGTPDLRDAFHPSIAVRREELDRGCARRLRAMLRERKPDVLHTHLGHADFVGLWASRGLPMARFCTMHNIWFKWSWKDRAIFAAYRQLFRRVVPDCHVVSISRSVDEHVRNRLGVPRERATIVENAIPAVHIAESRAQLRAELDIPEDAFCVLFVGRLRIQKSVDTLLRAAARLRRDLPSLRVLIVGAGEEHDALVRLDAELGNAGTVQFRGTTATPERYFAAADVFALPSVFEGFGLVILEAFRARIPVVATAIEGPAELIEAGKTGFLVPPKDDAALADRLRRLHDDPQLRARLAAAGHATFTERYSIERYAARLEEMYERAVHGNA